MLTINDLTLQIANRCLLYRLNLQCKPGQVWGILGLNGAGKTTLLHTLAGLSKPHAGTITWQQQCIHQISHKKRAQLIGLLLQDQSFPFPSSVLENTLLGRYPHQTSLFQQHDAEDIDIANKALKTTNLWHLASRAVTTLSGGEQRRLSLATLLTQDPKVFLLDEPTNHLDLHQQVNALTLFKSLAEERKKIVLMVLHDTNQIQKYCDHVLILKPEGQYTILSCDTLSKSNIEQSDWIDWIK